MTVTSHEAAIAERLRDAAGRIPVDTSALWSIETGGTRVTLGSRPRPRPRRKALIAGVAATALAGVAAVVVVVGQRSDHDTVTVRPLAACPMAPGDPSACSPSLVAHVASPPDWFGTPRSAIRDGGQRTGQWVSMAIGQSLSDGRVAAPIRVAVFDGTYSHLDDAEVVTIDGVPLRSTQIGDWQVLATTGTPTVLAEGSVDVDLLKAVLDAVDVGDPADGLSLRLRSLPEGYAEIVAPRSLGADAPYHRTLAGEFGGVGIGEASDLTDPLLAAAGAGVDLTAVDLGDGTTGWSGLAAGEPAGAVRFLIWSPEPGVVFEIDTYDTARPVDDLAALARATTAIDPALWDATYDD
jgi:hypothetical protein